MSNKCPMQKRMHNIYGFSWCKDWKVLAQFGHSHCIIVQCSIYIFVCQGFKTTKFVQTCVSLIVDVYGIFVGDYKLERETE